jgi:hypothetical protein
LFALTYPYLLDPPSFSQVRSSCTSLCLQLFGERCGQALSSAMHSSPPRLFVARVRQSVGATPTDSAPPPLHPHARKQSLSALVPALPTCAGKSPLSAVAAVCSPCAHARCCCRSRPRTAYISINVPPSPTLSFSGRAADGARSLSYPPAGRRRCAVAFASAGRPPTIRELGPLR